MTSGWKNMSGLLGKWKHKKLSEEWTGIKEPVQEGVTFYLKYLGSTLVESAKGEQSTSEAIKKVIHLAKAGGKKLKRVAITISPRGISTRDLATNDGHLDVSIYRISYCSADAHHERVVAFIATNKNEVMECHAFLCSKKRVAQAVALTISQAFNLAFELWKKEKEDDVKENENKTEQNIQPLIDLSPAEEPVMKPANPWTTFESDAVEDLFTQLSQERHLLDADRTTFSSQDNDNDLFNL